ncbi:MAG: hypothetical protein PIR02_11855 [Microbacterium enclense]
MSTPIDRDFGEPDSRSWTLDELYDEITRQAVDVLERREGDTIALLGVLVDVASLRATRAASTREAER